MKTWFEMKKNAENGAEISIFGDIGGWGVTAKQFIDDFKQVQNLKSIKLTIDSAGGSYTEGMAIYDYLEPYRDKIRVEVVGMAASIASILAISGGSMTMAKGSFYVIHNPYLDRGGDAKQLRKMADILDKMQDRAADIYAERTGLSRDDMLSAMDVETWYTADEAIKAGFADDITDYGQIAARLTDADMKIFKNIPVQLRTVKHVKPLERDIERALHAAGCSKAEAKTIIAYGFRANRRDAGTAERREAATEGMQAEREKYLARKERERYALRRKHE